MIAVIADDFTGAAEMGGIGLRYGLNVEIATRVNAASHSDLLVIDTNSRSVSEQEAVKKNEQATKAILKLEPGWIFKKTDSVLRGHIVQELKAQMKIAGMKRALLVPANPNLGRTIKNGMYFFQNKPIHESSFSIDPEFAVTSSDVQEMLRDKVDVRKPNESLPATGIIVGEATAMEDLDYWAAQFDHKTLAAGAAVFFSAILDHKKEAGRRDMVAEEMLESRLYISGTTFEQSTAAIKKIAAAGGPVSYLQPEKISAMLDTYGKAIIAIDPETKNKNALELRERTAELVQEVLRKNKISELIIEGGSTARAIFDKLNCTAFFPVQELAAGVVRMKMKEHEMFVTVKPGSYAWPPGTWNF